MKFSTYCQTVLLVGVLLPGSLTAKTKHQFSTIEPRKAETLQQKKQWFDAAKFGIFVHWNFSSITGEKVNLKKHPLLDPQSPWYDPKAQVDSNQTQFKDAERGTEISWGRIGPRPGKFHKSHIVMDHFTKMPYAQYNQLYKKFKPTAFDAERWTRCFSNAGARYMVIVSKHHDGFPMFDAEQSLSMNEYGYPKVNKNGHAIISQDKSGWKVTNPQSFGRDIVRELTNAGRKEGLKIGYYYSNPDWTNPDYDVLRNKPYKGGGTQERYVKYMHNHVEQLLTQYGDILTLWFDGLGGSDPSHWGGLDEYKKLRAISPSTLFNDRFLQSFNGKRKQYKGLEDYYTPERRKGRFDNANKWETCDISCQEHSWSYKEGNPVHPWQKIAGDLIDVIDNGGNYLMNIAPDGRGNLREQEYQLLENIGKWVNKHQLGIFNTKAGPFKPQGALSSSYRDKIVFLHARLNKMSDKKSFSLPKIPHNQLISAKLLNGEEIPFTIKKNTISFQTTSAFFDDEVAQTVALTYSKAIEGLYEIKAQSSEVNFPGVDISALANYQVNEVHPQYGKKLAKDALLQKNSEKGYAFHTKEMTKPSVTISLKNPMLIYGLIIENRTELSERAKGMIVEYSLDGKTFTKVWQDKAKTTPTRWNVALEKMQTGALIQGIKAKYLRLSLPGEKRIFHLKRVRIFGQK